MIRHTPFALVLALTALLTGTILPSGCGTAAPPTLSPAGQTAFANTRVIKGLDLLRDAAVDANAQRPPLLSDAVTRKVVVYHEASVKTIHALGTGWQTTLSSGLSEVIKSLSPAEHRVLLPYVTLAQTLIAEVG